MTIIKKPIPPAADAIAEADAKVRELAMLHGHHREYAAQMEAEIEAVRRKYQTWINPLLQDIDAAKKALVRHLSVARPVIFPADVSDAAAIDLPCGGAILCAEVQRVIRRRSVTVEALKAAGLTDGVKIVETVNWPEIETWPDDKLEKAGTARVSEERLDFTLPPVETTDAALQSPPDGVHDSAQRRQSRPGNQPQTSEAP